jgi:hypothetical protein
MGMAGLALATAESAAVDSAGAADEAEFERVLEAEGRRLFAIAFSILRDPGADAWRG